ncbi:MAG: DUF2141 domain-containing protein [Burkholderiaceae bacterium]
MFRPPPHSVSSHSCARVRTAAGSVARTRPATPRAALALIAASLAAVALTAGAGPARAADLIIQVQPAGSQGNLMLAVYGSAADFRQRAVVQQSQAASTAPARFRFDQLPPGDYAIAVYQDVNGNGKLDTNMVGMPREPFGFSQEPKGLMGPPNWDQVKFALPPEGTTINIRLEP